MPSKSKPTHDLKSHPRKAFSASTGEVEFLLPDFEKLPASLRSMPFAFWIAEQDTDRDDKPKVKPNGRPAIKKAPRNLGGINISKNKPEQWMPSETCRAGFDRRRHFGAGVLLQASAGIVGIDLDDIKELSVSFPSLVGILERAKSAGIYCERSPSNTGLHLYVKGSLPDNKGRKRGGIELYSDTSFLTVTGAVVWPGDVVDGQWLVDELLALTGTRTEKSTIKDFDTTAASATPADPTTVAKIGKRMAEEHSRLWQGLWEVPQVSNDDSFSNIEIKGYKSRSEAEFALCGHILRAAVKLHVPNEALFSTVIAVFKSSELYEEKERTLVKYTVPKLVAEHLATQPAEPVEDWSELKSLPSPLPPAPRLDMDLLPESLRPFVADVASRLQVPAEIISTPLIISLGSAIGKKLAVQPHAADPSWYEYPNLWGVGIMEPGMLKSPALNEATKFIRELEEDARIKHRAAMDQWASEEAMRKLFEKSNREELKSLVSDGKLNEASEAHKALKPIPKPIRRRYVIVDATPEARLQALEENPDGLMLIRDELSGHLANLHREGYEQARSQELQFFDAKFNYEDIRLKREGLFAAQPRMAMYGNLQPSKLEALLFERSQSAKGFDDGYLERLLQLAVMPVFDTDYTITKKPPDFEAERAVRKLFLAADRIPSPFEANPRGPSGRVIKFAPDAQELFDNAFEWLERMLRKSGGNARLKSHKGKFRGTIVKLALIFAFCESTAVKAISRSALLRAIKLTTFYLKHAKRIYALGDSSDVASAHQLLSHIKAGQVRDGFAARDIEMRKWPRLRTLGEIEGAIAVLCEHGFLRRVEDRKTGGAPSRKFFINPAIERKSRDQAA